MVSSAALLLLVVAGGCSLTRPAAEDAARALASDLSELDLSDTPMRGDPSGAQAALTDVVEGMGGLRPKVTVREVEETDDEASVVLSTTWRLDRSAATWTYTTRARLTYDGDRWRPHWDPAMVAPDLTGQERLRLRRVEAERGDITGAGGKALVTARPVVRVGIDKTTISAGQAKSSASRLANLFDVDVDAYERRVTAAGPKAFVEALVLRKGPDYPVATADVEAIPGAVQVPDELPLAPTHEFARPILGTVGEATAEMLASSESNLRPGDQVGLSGLQKRYDDRLRGRAGVRVDAVPMSGGGPSRTLHETAPVAGRALRTTIDPDLQATGEDVLAAVKPPSAIVAIRPSDGEVLAIASGPGGKGYSTASVGRYAPGSTFKVVTTLALLRAGLTGRSDVACTSRLSVEGKSFKNYSDYPAARLGTIPLRSAVANSCNTAFIAERDKAAQRALHDAATSLGLGPDVDLGSPAFLGSVPTKAPATEHAASMIGQGRVQASPLAMATVAASIARGQRVTPKLLVDAPVASRQVAGRELTATEATQLRSMTRAVVTEGSAGFLTAVPGAPVRAKTGTAEYGTDRPPRTHAWMIATHGDLAVAVFVEDGESGSQTAGPLLNKFLRDARER